MLKLSNQIKNRCFGNKPGQELYAQYHDNEWGIPVYNDQQLFEMLILEGAQAGLSWETILKRRENYRQAFHQFDAHKIAAMTDEDLADLKNNPGIIRNRLKINAAIHNAQVILELQKEFGSFKNWLDNHKKNTKEEWVKLFKKTFKFTGGEIVNEFLTSTAYLPGAHAKNCPIYKKSNPQHPPKST